MLIEPDYKGYRIHVQAKYSDGLWDATVRIRRVLSNDKPPRREGDVPEANRRGRGDPSGDLGPAVGRPVHVLLPCLASRFSVEETTLRDPAKLLVIRDRQLFTVRAEPAPVS